MKTRQVILLLVLTIGLALTLQFFVKTLPRAERPASLQVSPIPILPTVPIIPTAPINPSLPVPDYSPYPSPAELTATAEALIPRVSPCNFAQRAGSGLAISPTLNAPSLDQVDFSLPIPVLTSTNILAIQKWLPDNQRIIIAESIVNTFTQSIETFDINTKVTKVYGQVRDPYNFMWLPGEQAIAYLATNYPSGQLWYSTGDPKKAVRLLENIDALNDKSQSFSFMPPDLLALLRPTPIPADPRSWQYAKYPDYAKHAGLSYSIPMYRADQPGGSLIAFYGAPWWLFFYDRKTGQGCEVDLGMKDTDPLWPFEATWSPGGRYLVLNVSIYRTDLMPFEHLIVVDTINGDIFRPDFGLDIIKDFEWDASGQYLMIMGKADVRSALKMALFDTATQKFRKMLPDYPVSGGAGKLLALSPDGRLLAMNCATEGVSDCVCIVKTNFRP